MKKLEQIDKKWNRLEQWTLITASYLKASPLASNELGKLAAETLLKELH